jgi:hypothetical protein
VSRTLSRLTAACTGAVLALTLPGIASAAVTLPPNSVRTASATQTFTITTSGPFWSVVAVRPPTGMDYDLRLLRDGTQIATSAYGPSEVDFIAIDTNQLPRTTTYQATVVPYNGATGTYTVDFSNPQILMPPSGASGYVDLPNGQYIVVRDVWLNAGTNYGLLAGLAPYVFLMGDDPANSTTWVRNRQQAVARTNVTGSHKCARYLAPRSGWYGAVAIDWFPDHAGNTTQKYYVQPIGADNAHEFDDCRQY